jgi:uncharacterized Zn finger protein
MINPALPPAIHEAAIRVLPDDGGRYLARFEIRSESSNRVYRISFDSAPGAQYWKCSCPGNLRYGHCKHLTAMDLPGRRDGASREWAERLISQDR